MEHLTAVGADARGARFGLAYFMLVGGALAAAGGAGKAAVLLASRVLKDASGLGNNTGAGVGGAVGVGLLKKEYR